MHGISFIRELSMLLSPLVIWERKINGEKNEESSSHGSASGHSWAEKLKSNAKLWAAMHKHRKRKTDWNDLHSLCSKSCQNLSHSLWQLATADTYREEGWKRERERLSKCWFGVCLGQTTEYTEREIELHSRSLEVQTVLKAKFSNILSAQVDKTVIYVCVCVYQTVFSRADKPGRLPTYYCEFQVSARVHPALVVSHHEQTYM